MEAGRGRNPPKAFPLRRGTSRNPLPSETLQGGEEVKTENHLSTGTCLAARCPTLLRTRAILTSLRARRRPAGGPEQPPGRPASQDLSRSLLLVPANGGSKDLEISGRDGAPETNQRIFFERSLRDRWSLTENCGGASCRAILETFLKESLKEVSG